MGARSTPNVYSPASGDILIGGATAIQEFFGFTADCGQAAAEILYAWSQGKKPTGAHINAVVEDMNRLGLTTGRGAPQGVSTPSENSAYLAREGVPNFVTGNWQQALQQYVVNAGNSVRPIQLDVQSPTHNLGAQLPGDEFGVTGHFITVEGFSPSRNAFIVSDPDNSAAKSGNLVYYTLGQLRAAGAESAIVPTGAGKGINNAGGGPGVSGPPSQDQNPWSYIPFVGPYLGAVMSQENKVQQDATNAGVSVPNPFDPAQLAAVGEGFFKQGAFLLIAALIMLIGAIALFFPQGQQGAKTAAGTAAGTAAKAGAVAA